MYELVVKVQRLSRIFFLFLFLFLFLHFPSKFFSLVKYSNYKEAVPSPSDKPDLIAFPINPL